MTLPNIKTKAFVIPASGVARVGMGGNFIKCMTSTGASGGVLLSFDGSATTKFDALDKYKFPPGVSFTSFTLENQTGAAITMQVAVGFGDVDTGSAVTVAGTAAVNQTKSATFGDLADVTIDTVSGGGFKKVIAAADATRRSLIVVADPANNAAGIRIGVNATVGAARGSLLQPGQSLVVDTGAAVYAYATVNTDKVSLSFVSD